MWTRLSLSRCAIAVASIFSCLVDAHSVITYPGWRGDNLHTNGTVFDTNGLGVGFGNSSGPLFPYGMQWVYPCEFLASNLPLHSEQQWLLTESNRWWDAFINKSNEMASRWWSDCSSTRLVSRPCHRFRLYQLRLWHRAPKYEQSDGSGISNGWTNKRSLSGNVLLASSTSSGERKCENWR